MLKLAVLGGLLAVTALVPSHEPNVSVDHVLGPWLTGKKGAVIDIYRCARGKELCGRIAWLKKPYHKDGELKRDPENPSPSLRKRPLCGIQVFTGLRRTSADTWGRGRVYNPEDGRRYRAYVRVNDDGTLYIRGYIGIPLIGRSETWTRPDGIDIRCPPDPGSCLSPNPAASSAPARRHPRRRRASSAAADCRSSAVHSRPERSPAARPAPGSTR